MLRRRFAGLFLVFSFLAGAPAAQGADETLSSRLQELSAPQLRNASHAEQARAVSLLDTGAGSLLRHDGGIVVEIRISGAVDARSAALKSAGAEVLHVSREYRAITAAVDEADLRAVAAVPGVEYAEEVIAPMSGAAADGLGGQPGGGALNNCATGAQVSEAVTQMAVTAARTQFDTDGAGVKVGVLSDSFDTRASAATHAANDVAAGDLPGTSNPCGRNTPVDVVAEFPGQADEGRAMLQAVHDVAPGAALSFATALPSETAYADNIEALADAGADVITDDWLYFGEPIYQDGVVAKAINDVTSQGVSYVTMAYNSNRILSGQNVNSWEAAGVPHDHLPRRRRGHRLHELRPRRRFRPHLRDQRRCRQRRSHGSELGGAAVGRQRRLQPLHAQRRR